LGTEKLYSTLELSEILGITKQGVNKAEREGRIEAPAYSIGPYKGWTKEQVERIKDKFGISTDKEGERIKEEVKTIVKSIPIGVTSAGWEFLNENKELALSFLEIAIQQCNTDILRVEKSGDKEYIGFLPYMQSSLMRFIEIKEKLLGISK
jgi:hypothetical protein